MDFSQIDTMEKSAIVAATFRFDSVKLLIKAVNALLDRGIDPAQVYTVQGRNLVAELLVSFTLLGVPSADSYAEYKTKANELYRTVQRAVPSIKGPSPWEA